MWNSVVIFSGFLAAVSSFAITGPEIAQCVVNPGALPLAASVVGCDAPPCQLRIQDHVVIDIIFRAPRDTSTMITTATAYVNIMGLPIPIVYYLAESSVTCNYLLNSSCPVHEGDILLYTLKAYMRHTDTPLLMGFAIEFSIWDENYVPMACIRVPVEISPHRTHNVVHIN